MTWKAKSEILGVARKHKEINLLVEDPEKLGDLFEEIGLEKYAHPPADSGEGQMPLTEEINLDEEIRKQEAALEQPQAKLKPKSKLKFPTNNVSDGGLF